MTHEDRAKATIFSAMPPCSMSSPEKMKNGMARNQNTFIPEIMCWKIPGAGSLSYRIVADSGQRDREGDGHSQQEENQEGDQSTVSAMTEPPPAP